jgi:hypothetical protein
MLYFPKPGHYQEFHGSVAIAIWKTQILAHCMENNLDTYLLRDKAAPPAADAKKLEIYEYWRGKAAGILVQCMGQDNNNKFVTDSNRQNPRKLWLLLTNHYESTSADNQAKVFQNFCNLKFSKELSSFYNDLNSNLANMTVVGLKVGIPKKLIFMKTSWTSKLLANSPTCWLPPKTTSSPSDR